MQRESAIRQIYSFIDSINISYTCEPRRYNGRVGIRFTTETKDGVVHFTGERGQGTVEYVALVALVALIMVGVIAAMKSTQFAEGQQLGSLILKKIAEAVTKVHY